MPPRLDAGPAAGSRALWSAIDAAATPALTLAVLAALVRALSASDYGILVIAIAASGLAMAVNPAIAATTTKFVSELSGQRHHGRRTVAGVITVSLMTVAFVDILLLVGTVTFNQWLSRWIYGPGVASAQYLGRVLMLAMVAISIQQIEAVLAAAIRGLERFRRQAMIEIISRAGLTGGVIYVAWHTRSVQAILTAQCLGYLASTVVRAFALRQLLPENRFFRWAGRTEASRMLRYSGWMWLSALAGVVYTSADRIVIGRSLGVAAAGQYNIYVQIAQMIHFVPSSVVAFLLPAFSRLAAQGAEGRAEIARVYKTYQLAICVCTLLLATLMTFSWPLMLQILAGSALTGSDYVPQLLTLSFALLACNVAPYYLLIALGHAQAVSLVTSISIFAALVLLALLIPRFGLEGAAYARLAYGIGALMLLPLAKQWLRRS